jgi:hypothetical protein
MAGLDMGQEFYEPEKTMKAYREFNEKYSDTLETFSAPFSFSGQVMDLLDYKLYAWPGHGLPRDAAGWQFIEGEYMTVDEYDDIIPGPLGLLDAKVFPRVFGVFEPMRMFQQFTNITENVHIGQLAYWLPTRCRIC